MKERYSRTKMLSQTDRLPDRAEGAVTKVERNQDVPDRFQGQFKQSFSLSFIQTALGFGFGRHHLLSCGSKSWRLCTLLPFFAINQYWTGRSVHDFRCFVQTEQASQKTWMMTGGYQQVRADITG